MVLFLALWSRLMPRLRFVLVALVITGCSKDTGKAGTAAPAEKPKAESELAFTTLSKKAYAALEIKTQATNLKNAQAEHERALKLKGVKSQQDLEQAHKNFEFAKEDVATAKAKLTIFETSTIKLAAPRAGAILQLHAGPGQYVPVSAPLVTIIDLQPAWLRVPVPESELPLIQPKEDVTVTWKIPNAGQRLKLDYFTATYKGRVAQVDPQRHTADLGTSWTRRKRGLDAGKRGQVAGLACVNSSRRR
jgi:multidrug resistance efflux pump